MTEEGATPEGQAAEPTVQPSMVSADGSLVDGWQQHAPEGYEGLKEDKTLGSFKNVWDIGKSYVHVRKQVPVDKMPRPNETWGDDEWGEFHKAGGRPETAADYNIKRHEKIPEEAMPQETIDGFQDVLFRHGASQKLVDALVAYNDEQTLKVIQQQEDATTDLNTRLWDQLHDEWGRAYDQRVARGERAMERGTKGDEGFYQRIQAKANKDADWIKFLANMEDNFSENEPAESQNIPTPGDKKEEIDKLMADPRLYDRNVPLAVRQPLLDKIMRKREEMNRDKQPV